MKRNKKSKKMVRAGRRAYYTRLKRLGLSDWHAQEASGLLVQKAGERDQIAAFLREHHPDVPMVLWSLPGSRFEVERKLASVDPRTKFVCFERDAKFLRTARYIFDKHAPGGKLRNAGRKVLANKQTTLHIASAGDLAKFKLDEKLTAVWFDGMGLLTTEDFRLFLKGLRKNITRVGTIPAAFTFQVGRDADKHYSHTPGNIPGKRVRKLKNLANAAGLDIEIHDCWTYRSDTNGPLRMLNICARIGYKKTSKGIGRGKNNRRNSWSLLTFKQFDALREAMTPNGMKDLLGLSDVSHYDADTPPDDVSQAQLGRIIEAVHRMVLDW